MRSRRRLVARNLSVITTLAAFYFATVPFRCWYQIRCVKIICKGSILNTEMLGYELLTVGRYYAPQRDDQNKLVKLKPIDQAVKNAKITNNANDFTAHSKRTLKWFGVNLYKSLQNTTVLTTDQFTNIRDGHLTFFSAQIAHIVSSNHQPFSIHRPYIGTFSMRILCKYYKFIY